MVKVFVHGNPETAAIWGPLIGALQARGVQDSVQLSPPGFGAPTPHGWEATPARYAGWLIEEVERLGQPVDLVGHDWGAGHTFGLLAQQPGAVRSWAADCAGLLHPRYQWHELAQLWQQPGAGEQWVEQTLGLSVDERAERYRALDMGDDVARSLAVAFDAEMGRCILALYRGAAQPAMVELGDRVAASASGTAGLVINPDDPYVPADLAREVAARLGADVLELPSCRHWWMLQDPGAAADGLVAFWDQLEADG